MNQGPRARLLVVDDEQGIVEVVTTALNSAGYQVDSTDQAHIAIEAVRRGGLDAVILDVGLGDRSGFELMERWTAEGHRVPVIFLTARTDEEDVTRGLSIGADDYIRKPFGVKELIARVESVLRRTGGGEGEERERGARGGHGGSLGQSERRYCSRSERCAGVRARPRAWS